MPDGNNGLIHASVHSLTLRTYFVSLRVISYLQISIGPSMLISEMQLLYDLGPPSETQETIGISLVNVNVQSIL